MLHINMSHTLPMIGIRSQLSTLTSHTEPAQFSAHYQAPQNDQYVTAATVDINTYPSRHAYGFSTMDDVTKDLGAKGWQAIQERTSRYTQEAWELIKNGAKEDGGAYCIQMAKNKFKSSLNEGRDWHIELAQVPDPVFTPHVSELRGGIDPGSYDVNIDTKKDGADVQFNRGSFEVYLKQQGELNIWTEGSIDTFA